jgi:hypothetical protein
MELVTKKVNPHQLFDQSPLSKSLNLYMKTEASPTDNIIIAGGAARHLYNGSNYDDIDVYVLGQSEDIKWGIAHRIYNFIKSENSRISVEFSTPRNVPTISSEGQPAIQIIPFNTASSLDELFGGFDFTCCCFALIKDLLIYPKNSAIHHEKKKLFWTEGVLNSVEGSNLENRFWRIQKYLKKGYKFGKGQGDLFFDMPWNPQLEETVVGDRIRNQSSGSDTASPPVSSQPILFPTTEEITSSDYLSSLMHLDNLEDPPSVSAALDDNRIVFAELNEDRAAPVFVRGFNVAAIHEAFRNALSEEEITDQDSRRILNADGLSVENDLNSFLGRGFTCRYTKLDGAGYEIFFSEAEALRIELLENIHQLVDRESANG